MILRTPRLRLEPIQDSHFEGLRDLHANPAAMRFLGGPKTEDEVRAWISAARGHWARFGFSWWVAIEPGTEQLVGVVSTQHLETDEAKPIEIGWRLRPEHWGKGYATEAGQAMLRFAFDQVGVPEVYAVAHPENQASLRVMQRLGMRYAGLQPFYAKMCATYVKERG
jgi:RimJ/RimL family protein N-acetyltransferase